MGCWGLPASSSDKYHAMVEASKALAVEAKAELVKVSAQLDIARAVPTELSKKYELELEVRKTETLDLRKKLTEAEAYLEASHSKLSLLEKSEASAWDSLKKLETEKQAELITLGSYWLSQ